MTVAFDEIGRRVTASAKGSSFGAILVSSRRVTLLAGLGSLGLIAFTYGAFSFFGELADPRARLPRPKTATISMPDFKDGVPAPAPGRVTAPAPVVAETPRSPIVPASAGESFVPGFSQSEPAARPAIPAVARRPEAAAGSEERAGDATGSVARAATVKSVPAKVVAADSGSAELRPARPDPVKPDSDKPASSKSLPQIENAAAVQAAPRQAAVVAPLRLSNTLPPGKVETVRAKPVEEKSAAAAPAVRAAPTKAPEPVQADATKRANAAKPVREKPVRAASADGAPAARATAIRREAEEDSDDLGSKVTKGIKAIGGIFSSDD